MSLSLSLIYIYILLVMKHSVQYSLQRFQHLLSTAAFNARFAPRSFLAFVFHALPPTTHRAFDVSPREPTPRVPDRLSNGGGSESRKEIQAGRTEVVRRRCLVARWRVTETRRWGGGGWCWAQRFADWWERKLMLTHCRRLLCDIGDSFSSILFHLASAGPGRRRSPQPRAGRPEGLTSRHSSWTTKASRPGHRHRRHRFEGANRLETRRGLNRGFWIICVLMG